MKSSPRPTKPSTNSCSPPASSRRLRITSSSTGRKGKRLGSRVQTLWVRGLRWLIQRDVIVIPKSTHIERMQQNLEIFDFTLSDDDMEQIARLDTDKSLFFDHHDPDVVKMFMGWR
ncbi:MAG: aldo/keto reductase [Muribaculaceae bacterium]|nr:aldo/keto reductase [Muribaculaceae bacterium]